MAYEDLAVGMDQAVDEHLGNDVGYSTDAGATFPAVKGFVFLRTEGEIQEFMDIDPLNHSDRLKVSKALVAAPSADHIVRHPLLPGDRRPENWTTSTNGRYWLMTLQKV